MAVTVTKQKEAKASKAKEKPADTITEKVNRIVELQALMQPFEVLSKEYSKLIGELRVVADERDGTKPVVFSGTKGGAVQFSEKSKVTDLADMDTVKKVLGTKTFMEVATVGLADIRKYATPEEQAKLLTERAYSGSRKVSVVAEGK